jgi:hypothetical protein
MKLLVGESSELNWFRAAPFPPRPTSWVSSAAAISYYHDRSLPAEESLPLRSAVEAGEAFAGRWFERAQGDLEQFGAVAAHERSASLTSI